MFEKLRAIRKAQGYTCKQLAENLGITKATYSKKERGIIAISLDEAKKIAEILGYSVEEIF